MPCAVKRSDGRIPRQAMNRLDKCVDDVHSGNIRCAEQGLPMPSHEGSPPGRVREMDMQCVVREYPHTDLSQQRRARQATPCPCGALDLRTALG